MPEADIVHTRAVLTVLTDIRNLTELSVVHPGALIRPDMRTISVLYGLE